MKSFYKKHKRYIIIGGIALGCVCIVAAMSKNNTDVGDTTTVSATPVTVLDAASLAADMQIVEANGVVETLESVDLSSQVSATVARVNVALGDSVSRGQTLVVFSNADIAASLAGAQADLESAMANKQAIKAQYDAQEATVANVYTSTENAIFGARTAMQTALNNVRQSDSGFNSEVVLDAYQDMQTILYNIQDSLESIQNTADGFLGITDKFANDDIEQVFSAENPTYKNQAITTYEQAVREKDAFDTAIMSFPVGSTNESLLDEAVAQANTVLTTYRDMLVLLSNALDATPAVGSYTQAALDADKTVVISARSAISGHITSITNQSQAIRVAKKSGNTLQATYEQAVRDYETAVASAEQKRQTAESQLQQIEASVSLQDAQIKSARARVASISASLAKTVITAPIGGTIASLPVKVGELMNPGTLAVRVVNTGAYQVKAFIAAEEVQDIATGNKATIANKYEGIVTNVSPSIDPKTSKVEVILLVTSESPVLISDQFVSVTIERSIQEDAVFTRIPLEAVRLTSNGATVLVVNEDSMLEERIITIGEVVGSSIEADLRDILLPVVSSVRSLEVGESVTITE